MNCYYCGERSQIRHNGVPVCAACYPSTNNPEEYKTQERKTDPSELDPSLERSIRVVEAYRARVNAGASTELDVLAEQFYGVTREVGETDTELRYRIQKKVEALSP